MGGGGGVTVVLNLKIRGRSNQTKGWKGPKSKGSSGRLHPSLGRSVIHRSLSPPVEQNLLISSVQTMHSDITTGGKEKAMRQMLITQIRHSILPQRVLMSRRSGGKIVQVHLFKIHVAS